MPNWLIRKSATEADFQRYSHGSDHFEEMLQLVADAGLEDFEADVVVDLATGRGDACAAAIEVGAATPYSRVIFHDHADAAEPVLQRRFSFNFEFCGNETLRDIPPAVSGAKILIICSHLLGQADDEHTQAQLEQDLKEITRSLSSFIKLAERVVFVSLEPGHRGNHLSARTSWRVLFAHEGVASHVTTFRVRNRSRDFGIPKCGTVHELVHAENLSPIDSRILRSGTYNLESGFGEVFHEAIECKIFALNDGISFGKTKEFVRITELEKINAQLRQREDKVNAANDMNLAILGMIP